MPGEVYVDTISNRSLHSLIKATKKCEVLLSVVCKFHEPSMIKCSYRHVLYGHGLHTSGACACQTVMSSGLTLYKYGSVSRTPSLGDLF